VSSGVKNALHTLSCLFAKPFGRKMKEFTLVFYYFGIILATKARAYAYKHAAAREQVQIV